MMKISQLRTYWNAGDAELVIGFLDERRDVIWTAYGEEIIAMHVQDAGNENAIAGEGHDDQQADLDFDDKIEF